MCVWMLLKPFQVLDKQLAACECKYAETLTRVAVKPCARRCYVLIGKDGVRETGVICV